jgi:putative membrane fusion protein
MKERGQRKKGKGYIRAAMLAVLTLVLAKAVVGVGENTVETALVGYGDVRISESTAGVIVRKEQVIKAPISGSIIYAAKENQRVPVGTKLLEMKKETINEELTGKYNEISQRLQALQSADNSRAVPAEIERSIKEGLENIAFSLNEGNLAAAYSQKERLTREINISLAAGTTRSEREELLRQKEELDNILEGGIKAEFAPFSGVPVYPLDGYEELLHPENLEEIVPSKVAPVEAKKVDLSGQLEAGQPVMKMVANHEWYAVCSLSKSFAESLEKGSVVNLEISKEQTHSVRAVVKNKVEQEEGPVVFFESKDYFPGLYEERNVEMTVVKGKYSGLVVPLSAITEKDGEYLVEVLDADKTITKKVLLKGHDGISAVVEQTGSSQGIKLYDKVVLGKEREN